MEKPRGRAALIQLLRRPGGETDASTSTQPSEATQTPQPRGRAQLFEKLKKLNQNPPKTETAIQDDPGPVEALMTKLDISSEPFQKAPKGTSGTHISINANFVKLTRKKDMGFHRYFIQFDPDIDSKVARVKLVKAVVPKLSTVHMFNGATDLYLPHKLSDNQVILESPHPFDGECIVTMTIIYKKLEPFGSTDSLHFINVLFKRIMNKLQMNPIGRNYFNMNLSKFIPQYNLEVIPGYAVAVHEMEDGLMLCFDTCHKLLRKKSVLDILTEIRHGNPSNYKTKAIDEIIGQSVLTSYNNASYIIDDIMWDMTPMNTFETKAGPLTFADYYKKRYGLEIMNLTQPLLLHLDKKKTSVVGQIKEFHVCLVPEFCNVTGIKQDMMTNKFKKDIAEYTRLPPSKRFAILNKYVENVRNTPAASQLLEDWGFTIADAVIDLNARVIQDTKVTLRRTNIDVAKVPDWGREIGRDNLINPVDLLNWIVVFPEKFTKETQRFIHKLRDLADGFGCRIDLPRFVPVGGKYYDSDYRKALDQGFNDNVQMVLVVMIMPRESLYNEVKSYTLCRKGISSQMVRIQTLQNDKRFQSVILKIGLQMQAKLGGSLWGLAFPNVCKGFMFCGIDTFHAKGKKSVGAIVCSINEDHTRYYTGLSFQENEIAESLRLHFREAIEVRKRLTGTYPSVIFIVRDGVSDGCLQHVKDFEVTQYLSVTQDLGIEFTMCFLVLQKRINARFALRRDNPPAGTVVDHTITRAHYDDFYLVPQHTKIGTVSPSHYIVLHNNTKELNMDRIQKLSFKLCHLYYNWSGAVSVPAPCQYAHKAAYLIGQNLDRMPSANLSDKLYYL